MNENVPTTEAQLPPDDEEFNAFARELFELVLATEEARFLPTEEAQINLLRHAAGVALQNPNLQAALDKLITKVTGFAIAWVDRELPVSELSVPTSLKAETLIGSQEVFDNYFAPQEVILASSDLAIFVAERRNYTLKVYNFYTDLELRLAANYEHYKQGYTLEVLLYEPSLEQIFTGRWECSFKAGGENLPLVKTGDNRYILTPTVPLSWLSKLALSYRLLE